MRTLILLLMTTVSLASASTDEEFEKKFFKLQKDFYATVESLQEGKSYPDDKLIEEYSKLINQHVGREIALHKEFCKDKNDKACISDEDIEKKKEKFRVLVKLETLKNNAAKEGLSEDKTKEREAAFKSCVEKKDNCEDLSPADRRLASSTAEESSSEISTTTVTTQASTTVSNNQQAKIKFTGESKERVVSTGAKDAPAEVSVAATKTDPAKAEPAKEEPAKAEPAKTETAKAEPAKEELAKAEPTKTEPTKTEPTKKDSAELTEISDDEKTPRNYKAESCRWVKDLPRKIVNGPGCGPRNRSKICTGYVVCEQKKGGAKFIRMSTCSADKCGSSDEDAVKCTKDMGYYSMRPQGETKLFMSRELKKVLSSGAIGQ